MEKQDQKLKVLLGLTGSVATTLYKVLIRQLQEAGYIVDVILTESAKRFINVESVFPLTVQRMLSVYGAGCFTDSDEWNGTWTKGDPVMHIDMANAYSALVIAPCSANTLAKIANGICDNLLTSVVRAWPWYKPLIVAPAMNTRMWNHPITKVHINTFVKAGDHNIIVNPQSKVLACGTEGMGAMAEVKYIVEALDAELTWGNPLGCAPGLIVPISPHPGAFAAPRNGHTHTGLDLYAEENTIVDAVEDGEIVSIGHFTGPQIGSSWWEDTECVMVQGASGVVNYGEITPNICQAPGRMVRRGEVIGYVKRVIKEGKEHPEVTGWMPSMLHLELYRWDDTKSVDTFDASVHRDPTPFILKAVPLAKRVSWP